MPANTPIYNTGGEFRFIDYVSLLPEFMREEKDVVTLMQIFSDYMNNAYRNTTVADSFEFKLVATEGHANTRTIELRKLMDIFRKCEARNLPVMYLQKPINPASTIIEYGGESDSPLVNIIPGGCMVGDKFYIEFTKAPDRSGVYVAVDSFGKSVSNLEPYRLLLDGNSFSQDPFSASPDKLILTAVGYVPRAIQFYPSNISDVFCRNVGVFDGVVYNEVFFTATISNIENAPALDNYEYNGIKYLVDYYNIFNGIYPDEYSIHHHISFEHSTGCDPFDNSRGLFYAKELTKADTRDEIVNAHGINKYIDPSYDYNSNLFFSNYVENTSDRRLRADSVAWQQVVPQDDSYVGRYVNRITVGSVFSHADLSQSELVENWLYLTGATALRIGDSVKVTYTNGSPVGGIVNDSIHVISAMSSDLKYVQLRGVDITELSVGEIKISRIDYHPYDVAKILSYTAGKFIYERYCGDMITAGEFVIRNGNEIVLYFKTENDITNWSKFSSVIYYVGDLVHYNGIRYRVTKAHSISDINGNPKSENKYYVNDMDQITESTYQIDYNPYMFGCYRSRRQPYNEPIDYAADVSMLYDQLIVQPTEQVGVVFRNDQREWLFNPRLATQDEFVRNGWFTVFSEADGVNRRSDLGNVNAENRYVIPASTRSFMNRVTMVFADPHNLSVGDHIEVIGDSTNVINGIYSIALVTDLYTIVYETKNQIGKDAVVYDGVIKIINKDSITSNTVFYSNKNLIDVSDVNPSICDSGYYYKYTLKSIDWAKYSTRKVPDEELAVDIPNISKMYGEQKLIGISGTVRLLSDGDVLNLTNQINQAENGYWRVKKNSYWTRCGSKVVIKASELIIDAEVVSELSISDNAIYYKRHTESSVLQQSLNANVFIVDNKQISDSRFTRPSIEGIDTTASMHNMYDARFDSNTIAEKPAGFIGIPDMRYPIAEKIERLMYMKDPNVIDFDLIGYLARFMGYDISPIYSDIQRSDLYRTTKAREMAVRKTIQLLPEYNALKSTEPGLNSILLTFGIVSKIIHMWTEMNNPYDVLVPDVDLESYRFTEMSSNRIPNMVATPHFMARIEVDGNLSTSLTADDIGRVRTAIINYKPINTVFSGMEAYLKVNASVTVSVSPMNAVGRMQADVGYSFGDIVDNNCSI